MRVPSPPKEYTKRLKTEHWTVIQQERYCGKDRTKPVSIFVTNLAKAEGEGIMIIPITAQS